MDCISRRRRGRRCLPSVRLPREPSRSLLACQALTRMRLTTNAPATIAIRRTAGTTRLEFIGPEIRPPGRPGSGLPPGRLQGGIARPGPEAGERSTEALEQDCQAGPSRAPLTPLPRRFPVGLSDDFPNARGSATMRCVIVPSGRHRPCRDGDATEPRGAVCETTTPITLVKLRRCCRSHGRPRPYRARPPGPAAAAQRLGGPRTRRTVPGEGPTCRQPRRRPRRQRG